MEEAERPQRRGVVTRSVIGESEPLNEMLVGGIACMEASVAIDGERKVALIEGDRSPAFLHGVGERTRECRQSHDDQRRSDHEEPDHPPRDTRDFPGRDRRRRPLRGRVLHRSHAVDDLPRRGTACDGSGEACPTIPSACDSLPERCHERPRQGIDPMIATPIGRGDATFATPSPGVGRYGGPPCLPHRTSPCATPLHTSDRMARTDRAPSSR